jgi:hypothetical protein
MTDILFEDVCIGKIGFSNHGSNIEFEIWSTYDGRMLAKVVCLDAKSISIQNPDANEEHEEFFFGSYIALVRVEEMEREDNKKDYQLVMESGTVWVEVICRAVEKFDLDKGST